MHATLPLLEVSDFPAIRRDRLQTLQINLGYRCNQQCLHCHVNASPKRKENMESQTADDIIRFVQSGTVDTVDLTGGAPELNPHFRRIVLAARACGVHVIDRCNLTILLDDGQQNLAEFLAANRVEVIASLPCYTQENVDGQRGKGVFHASIEGLRTLNRLGYGQADSALTINLVYNPLGPFLPPDQTQLQQDYKTQLFENFGIVFNQLYTLANMPIKRFGSTLISKGRFNEYMTLLRSAHKIQNLAQVMCRSLISVDWRGYVYDCDFNQMLNLPLRLHGREGLHIRDLFGTDLQGNPIIVADHCYGCTAGQGSSCGGALSE